MFTTSALFSLNVVWRGLALPVSSPDRSFISTRIKEGWRVEKEIAKQYAYQYELTVLKAFSEVNNALVEVSTYSNECQALTQQVNATRKALTLSRSLYDNGCTSFLQVLDAERQYFDSEFQKSLACQYQLTFKVYLYKALGDGW